MLFESERKSNHSAELYLSPHLIKIWCAVHHSQLAWHSVRKTVADMKHCLQNPVDLIHTVIRLALEVENWRNRPLKIISYCWLFTKHVRPSFHMHFWILSWFHGRGWFLISNSQKMWWHRNTWTFWHHLIIWELVAFGISCRHAVCICTIPEATAKWFSHRDQHAWCGNQR